MRRLSAHYVLYNSQLLQYGTIVLDEQGMFITVELPQKPFVEKSGVEFFNGVLVVVPKNYNIDFMQIQSGVSLQTVFPETMNFGEKVQVLQLSPIAMDALTILPETIVRVV